MMKKEKGVSCLSFWEMGKAWVERVKQRERRERKGGRDFWGEAGTEKSWREKKGKKPEKKEEGKEERKLKPKPKD